MEWKEVHTYAFQDFWSQKPRWTHPFYKLLSYIITPLAVLLFNNAQTIPVYHDARVMSTFRKSVGRMLEGASLVIFPEHDAPYNHILYEFQERFVDVARMYYRSAGTAVAFVPMYICPALSKMVIGIMYLILEKTILSLKSFSHHHIQRQYRKIQYLKKKNII